MDLRTALHDLVSRGRTRTVTHDVALGLVLFTAAALVVAGWFNYTLQVNQAERDLNQRADILADELAKVVAAPLATADLPALNQVANAYCGVRDVAGLVVVDDAGTVLFRSVPEESNPLRRTHTIYSGSRLVGQLELWLSRRSLETIGQNVLAVTTATILVVGLGLWVATAFLLQRHLARPLQQLTREIDHIAASHYASAVGPMPQADFARLVGKINAMAEQIADRDAALRRREEEFQRDPLERKRAEQVQAATYRISEAALTAPTLDELYSSLHAIVGELMPARNFFIALYDAHTDLLHFVYHADEYDMAWEPMRPGKTLTGYVLQTGKSLLATAEVFEQMVQAGLAELVGEASQDWLGVPLKTQQAVLGVMVVQTYHDAPRLGGTERDLLTFVSTQVAMAIERRQAEEALRLDEARLDALAQLNERTDASEKAITDFALAEAVRLTKSSIGFLGAVNEAEDALTIVSGWGNPGAGDLDNLPPLAFQVTPGGALHDVIRQRKPVVVNYCPPGATSLAQPPGHVPVERHVIVPVFEGERIVVVADVGNKAEPYDEADVRQLTLLMQGMWRILQRGRAMVEIRQLNADLERRVEERTAQLTAANQELEAFAYSVSHDLRTPLRAINGFSQLMLEDYGGQMNVDAREMLHRIRAATVHMAQLIDDLLQLSRVTRSEIELREVDLSQLVGEGVARLRSDDPAREVEVRLPQQCVVRADANLMRIALANLLDNAWKFTRLGQAAQIEFGCDEQAGQTVYFIRDNGAGFDNAYAGKLFGAFQRLHASDEFEGTGIGLAIVQRIIHRHGGKIWAEGAVDQGATFYFTLG